MKHKHLISALLAACSLTAAAQVNSPDTQGYAERARLMFDNRNYNGCLDQLSQLRQAAPDAAQLEEADWLTALSAAHLGKADAMPLLKYFIHRYPASARIPLAMLRLGNLQLDHTLYGEALATYLAIDRSTLDRSSDQQLAYNTAFCLIKRDQYDRAEMLLRPLSAKGTYANGARFYLGYIAYVRHDYDEALRQFRSLKTSLPPADMTPYYLAQIAYAQADWSRAYDISRSLLNNSDCPPQFAAEATRIAGEAQYHLGNDADAITLLDNYLTLTDSPLPSALYILGLADYARGDYEAAITNLTPVAQLDNAMGQSALLTIGQAMMQNANHSGAMIALEKAARMDFDPAVKENAYYNYAVARTEGGRTPFGSSVTTFEEFLRTFPDSRFAPAVREYIVTGYMTDNNYPAALASIEAINNPSDKILKAKQQVLYTLGARQLAAGNAPDAEQRLRHALPLASHNPAIGAETQLWLGEALYAQGKYTEAATQLNAAIRNRNLSADSKPLALYDLGYALFADGRYDDAASRFGDFVTNPGSSSSLTVADAYNRIGDARYHANDITRAADAYARAAATEPSAADYPLYQGALMKGLKNDYNGQAQGLLAMMQRFPQSSLVPSALLELGQTYDRQGLPDKTIETYSTLAARYTATPQGRQASLLMALTYINNGNTPQAISTYRSLITASPTSDEARQAADRLKTLMAEQGQLDEYLAFVNATPGLEPAGINDVEQAAFAAAEREFIARGTTGRLTEYIGRYPDGAHRPEALLYAIRAARRDGDNARALAMAAELTDRYPDNIHAPEALLAKADVEYLQGKGELALDDYTRLSQSAPDPYMANEALIGIIRTARDLNLNDRVIAAADPLMVSSTVTPAQRSEATFAKALALSLRDNKDEAAALWRTLSPDLNDLYGVKAAFYLAQQEFDLQHTDDALTAVNYIIDSDTPHNYWLARAFILLSDIHRRQGNDFEARQYLISLRDNYPGSEVDITNLIDQRLNELQ